MLHRGIIRKRLALLLALMAAPFVSAFALDEGEFKPLSKYHFVYISSNRNADIPYPTDSLFNKYAQGIRFKVNRTELRPDDPFIRIYRNEIVPLLLDKGLVLRKILIKGAASPEGPYDNNVRLGKGRTRRMVELINSELHTTFDPSLVETSSITEDYAYLIVLMREAADPEADLVERIWRDAGYDERKCKAALMAYNKGATWKRLLKVYFPTLRQARVMLWFGVAPETKPSAMRVVVPPAPTASALLPMPSMDVDASMLAVPTLPVATPSLLAKRLPLIAVRTNLVHDFFYMPNFGFAPSPNIQLEYFPRRGHLTYNVGFTFGNHRHWQDYKFFQIRDVQFELRRYFQKGHPYRHFFAGAYAHGFCYGIGFDQRRGWEGEGAGAGLSGGYTMALNKKGSLRLELTAALGFFATKYDPYIYGNPINGDKDGKYYYDYTGYASRFKKRNHLFTWLGPTNVGIQIAYDLIYRKKGGAR